MTLFPDPSAFLEKLELQLSTNYFPGTFQLCNGYVTNFSTLTRYITNYIILFKDNYSTKIFLYFRCLSSSSMGLRDLLKRLIGSRKKEKSEKGIELEEWEAEVRRITNHPLSQVKVINTAILESLTDVLRNIDYKLDNLEKLDRILEILEKKEFFDKGIEKRKLEAKNLSEKDFMILRIVKNKKSVTITELMKLAQVSRSTASYRLNKLVYLGLIEKKMVGKKAVFVPKAEETRAEEGQMS
ncbi:hypothetical protein DRN63_03080 [Nanoarchaeota archaeon]|nr:MAG: hypothetical protein DRN63_03080 [Nanoarchaeota archaeon]